MKKKEPKILIYDIETAPNLGYYFELYREGNILWNEKHWYMLSYSYKWLDSKTTKVVALPDFKNYKKDKEDDSALVKSLWELFNEADVVVAHNGNSFDQKKSNARFIYHRIPPPSPYQQIDTKLVAKRYFKFDSNKLNDLGEYLGVGRKLPNDGKEMWKKCVYGDMKAWAKMKKYNIQDVKLLEDVYLVLRPWMQNHPNLALMNGEHYACPNCASCKLHKRGVRYSRVSVYQRFVCNDCSAWSQSPMAEGSQIR